MKLQGSGQAEHERRGADQRDLGTCRDCSANGAYPEAAGDYQTDFRGQPQRALPQGADSVIDFIDHL